MGEVIKFVFSDKYEASQAPGTRFYSNPGLAALGP